MTSSLGRERASPTRWLAEINPDYVRTVLGQIWDRADTFGTNLGQPDKIRPRADGIRTLLGQIWDFRRTVLGQFSDSFGTDLGQGGQIWDRADRFGTGRTDLGQIWDRFGTLLGQIWDLLKAPWMTLTDESGELGTTQPHPLGEFVSAALRRWDLRS